MTHRKVGASLHSQRIQVTQGLLSEFYIYRVGPHSPPQGVASYALKVSARFLLYKLYIHSMGNDSRKERSRSEAPSRRSHHSGGSGHQSSSHASSSRSSSRHSSSSNRYSSPVAYSINSRTRPPRGPSRLSTVTNASDELDEQVSALNGLSFGKQPYKLTFDTLGQWIRDGGSLDSLDDQTRNELLQQYLLSDDDAPKRKTYKTEKAVPMEAPVPPIYEEEEDGGVSLTEPPSKKDKGKGRAR